MVKLISFLIIKLLVKVLYLGILSSCSIFNESPSQYNWTGYQAERISDIKVHYNKLLSNFLYDKNFVEIPSEHILWLRNNLRVGKLLIKKVILLKSDKSFYFVSPDGTFLITSRFANKYFQNERLLLSFFTEGVVRIKNNFYSKIISYLNYQLEPEDLVNMMRLNLSTKKLP